MELTFVNFWQDIISNPMLFITVLLTLGVIFVNGWTDAPNAIATCVATRCMPVRAAIMMSAVFNFLGVFVMTQINSSVASTISNMVDFGNHTDEALIALCAALLSIVIYSTAASFFGIPTSESHSLIAGLSGAAIAIQQGVGGIGPEIVTEAMKVLDRTAEVYGHECVYTQLLMGGASIDVHGVPLTDETISKAKLCDAVLMGSIGGDTRTSPWYQLEPSKRPEAGLLKIRKELNLFANLRPAVLYEELKEACPLKEEIIKDGFDLMIMRELTGGLYFGERSTRDIDGVMTACDTLTYNEEEIRRIAKRGFDIAAKRRKKVTSVDKANVLDSSRLWRSVVEEVAKEYPEVTLEHMLVDNCAMQLVKDPAQFDVILTENMFGDILSDEASMVTGSIGMLSSASLNETKFGLYEPSGGSAPDIAGKGIANPIATILSAAMMLRFTFDLDREADAIEEAVQRVLRDGYRTIDIMSEGSIQINTREMGDRICAYIQ